MAGVARACAWLLLAAVTAAAGAAADFQCCDDVSNNSTCCSCYVGCDSLADLCTNCTGCSAGFYRQYSLVSNVSTTEGTTATTRGTTQEPFLTTEPPSNGTASLKLEELEERSEEVGTCALPPLDQSRWRCVQKCDAGFTSPPPPWDEEKAECYYCQIPRCRHCVDHCKCGQCEDGYRGDYCEEEDEDKGNCTEGLFLCYWVPVVGGVLLLVVIIVPIAVCCVRRRKRKRDEENRAPPALPTPEQLHEEEIRARNSMSGEGNGASEHGGLPPGKDLGPLYENVNRIQKMSERVIEGHDNVLRYTPEPMRRAEQLPALPAPPAASTDSSSSDEVYDDPHKNPPPFMAATAAASPPATGPHSSHSVSQRPPAPLPVPEPAQGSRNMPLPPTPETPRQGKAANPKKKKKKKKLVKPMDEAVKHDYQNEQYIMELRKQHELTTAAGVRGMNSENSVNGIGGDIMNQNGGTSLPRVTHNATAAAGEEEGEIAEDYENEDVINAMKKPEVRPKPANRVPATPASSSSAPAAADRNPYDQQVPAPAPCSQQKVPYYNLTHGGTAKGDESLHQQGEPNTAVAGHVMNTEDIVNGVSGNVMNQNGGTSLPRVTHNATAAAGEEEGEIDEDYENGDVINAMKKPEVRPKPANRVPATPASSSSAPAAAARSPYDQQVPAPAADTQQKAPYYNLTTGGTAKGGQDEYYNLS